MFQKPPEPWHVLAHATASRRDVMKAFGASGVALGLGPLLAACGGNGNGDDGETVASGDVGEEIRTLLDLNTGDELLEGTDFPIGIVVALSGPQTSLGVPQLNGAKLAVKHIKAAGGPNIELIEKDHLSGDPQAGARVTQELGLAEVSAVLASFIGVFGSMLPGVERFKMLTLDGGGGIAQAFIGAPFFWGTRAITPDDTFPGIYRYYDEILPDATRVALVPWDVGPEYVKSVEVPLDAVLSDYGMERVTTIPAAVGATDFSSVISGLREAEPDIVQYTGYGPDPGHFMRAYSAAGIEAPVMGVEYVPQAGEVAGSTYLDFEFATDHFNIAEPPNAWSELFLAEYRNEFDEDPLFFSANQYENTFAFWDLMRRVEQRGGNIMSGEDLQKALVEDPVFKSVYGGEGNEVGEYTLDVETHSVSQRPMGIFRFEEPPPDAQPVEIASFDIGGGDFRMLETVE